MHRHKLKRGSAVPFVGTTLDDYYLWLNQVINRNRPALDRWELNEAFRSLGSLLNEAITTGDTHVLSTNLAAGVGATYLHNANGSYIAFLGGLRYLYTATDGTDVSSFDIRAGASSVSLSHGNTAGVTAAVLDLNATGTSYVGGSKVGEMLVSTNDVANTVLRYGSVLQLVQDGASPPYNEYTPFSLPQTVVVGDIGKVLTVLSTTEIGMVTPTTGTGTTNTLAMFTSANVLGDSVLTQSGTDINAAGNLGFGGNLVDTTNSKIIESGVSDHYVQLKHIQAGYGLWARSTVLSGRTMGIDGNSGEMNLYTNSSVKMTITSSGDVGIGISSPAYKLDVEHNTTDPYQIHLQNNDILATSSTGMIFQNAQNIQSSFQLTNSNYVPVNGAYASQFSVNGSGEGGLALAATNAAGNIRFYTAGFASSFNKERMVINQTGDVGIGTTSPVSKLDVFDASPLTFRNSATDGFTLSQTNTNSWAYTGLSASMNLGFQNTSIGIGTTSPTDKLHVLGTSMRLDGDGNNSFFHIESGSLTKSANINLSNSAGRFAISLTPTTNSLKIGSLNGGVPTSIWADYTNGNVGIRTSIAPVAELSLSQTVTVGPKINMYNGLGYGFGVSSSDLDYYSEANHRWYTGSTATTQGDEKFTILQNGDVGIGITSPTGKLSIKHADNTTGFNLINDTGFPSVSMLTNVNGRGQIEVEDGTGNTKAYIYGNGEHHLYDTGGALDVKLTPNGSSYFNGGNVGIGTSSPGLRLDVIGSNGAQFRLSSSEADATIKNSYIQGRSYLNAEEDVTTLLTSASATTNTLNFGGGSSVQNAVNTLAFFTAPSVNTLLGTERMRINPSGNVGIGTTTPAVKLDVDGEININRTGTAGAVIKLNPNGVSQHSKIHMGYTTGGGVLIEAGTMGSGSPIPGIPGLVFTTTNSSAPAVGFQTLASASGHIAFSPQAVESLRLWANGTIKFSNYGGGTITGTATKTLSVTATGEVIETAPIEQISGWADYTDTLYTTGSPLVLADGVKVTLPNNKATINESQLPSDITTFYDGSAITGRDGDGILITIEFQCRPTSAAVTRIRTAIDIGGAVGEIYVREFALTKGNGIEHFYSATTAAYTLGTWEANGGIVKVESIGGGAEVYDIRYVITRTHKAN